MLGLGYIVLIVMSHSTIAYTHFEDSVVSEGYAMILNDH